MLPDYLGMSHIIVIWVTAGASTRPQLVFSIASECGRNQIEGGSSCLNGLAANA